nr:hypothetical protein [Polymorphobacter sp.]
MDQSAPATTDVPTRPRLRLGDFELRGGRIVLAKTGNSAAIDRALLGEVATWVGCFLLIRARALFVARRPGRSIWFTPDVPHPRYMVRIAAIAAGITVARTPGEATAAFFFEDATSSVAPAVDHDRAFNFGCGDISKSRVARVFAEVFGYPLALDPARWHGDAVEKSEANGTHDGRVVACPYVAQPGKVYQCLVDTVRADGFAYDLRTHVVGGSVVAVWVKQRDAAGRFLPPNRAATLVDPATVFSPAELARIGAFATAMGADWAGLDILRDEPSGRIYIVDVNKTDAGPIIALPVAAKLRSVAVLAKALTALIDQPSSAAVSASTRASRAA